MQLILVRHGLPVRGKNPGLSATGQHQAQETANYLETLKIDKLVSSPLKRAQETGLSLSRALQKPMTLIEGLAEFDKDSDFYIPPSEWRLENPEAYRAFAKDPYGYGGVDTVEFFEAVIGSFERLIGDHSGQTVVAFTHGVVTNVICAHTLNLPLAPLYFFPDYASITRIRGNASGKKTIFSLNETSHFSKPPGGR